MIREINIEGKRDKNGIIDIKVPESEKPLNVYEIARENIPVGTKITKSDVEVVKPQTDLDEYEDDSDIIEAKPKSKSVLKEYQKDVIENDIKKKLSENVLTPEEEEALKEKFIQEKTDEIMKGIEDLSKTYIPGENVDSTKKINDMDAIRTVAKLFGLDKYFVKVPPVKLEEKEEYVKPELKIVDGMIGLDEEKKPSSKTFDTICLEIMDLHAKKNKDYGNAAHQSYKEFGITSYVIRLNDKLNRLKALTKPGATMKVQDESIIDTLKDLAAYAIMAIESLKN